MLLGNDVVDLRDALPLAKERDPRFLARVFTPAEQACLQEAESPALALWLLWATKESLFKVVSKLEPGTVFAHAAFSFRQAQLASFRSLAPAGGKLALATLHKHYRIHLSWEWNPEFVHCMAGWGGEEAWASQVLATAEASPGNLTAREALSVHSPESRKVRLLAKQLLRDSHGLRSPEVVRESRAHARAAPPIVLEGGRPVSGLDLSLSHDGRFVAAMVSL